MNRILLPARDGVTIELTGEQAYGTILAYCTDNWSAVDLYDRTNAGPHNELEPIDLLSLNALNAFAGGGAMTAMHFAWAKKDTISRMMEPITTTDFTALDPKELESERTKICAALDWFFNESVKYWKGSTRPAKLLYRLRPNIIPIWDQVIGASYTDCDRSWGDFIAEVHGHVKEYRDTLARVQNRLVGQIKLEIPLLRLWDMLLWKSSEQAGRAAEIEE